MGDNEGKRRRHAVGVFMVQLSTYWRHELWMQKSDDRLHVRPYLQQIQTEGNKENEAFLKTTSSKAENIRL